MSASPQGGSVDSTHSPGPWRVVGGHIYDADGESVAIYDEGTQTREVEQANARLLAAAPDLLAALRAALAVWNDYREDNPEYINDAEARARAAIARATDERSEEAP